MTEDGHARNKYSGHNRSLRLFSPFSQALFLAEDESSLLADVCRLVVDTGGYLMAWVGFAQQDENKTIRLVACYGKGKDYVENLKPTWSDTERRQSAAGAAIRTGITQIKQDFPGNSTLAPWLKRNFEHGHRSSMALPLAANGKVVGALCIYASEVDAFNPDEVEMLEELAANLAFGIQTLRARSNTGSTEKNFQRSMDQYRRIVETSNEGIWSLDAARKTDFVNTALCRKLGYSPDEMLGRPIEDFLFEEDKQKMLEEMPDRLAGTGYRHEQRLRCKDGSELWCLVHGTPLMDDHGRFKGVFAMIADITERKRAEAELKQTTLLLDSIVENLPNMLFLKRASDLRFEFINRAAEELIGVKREAVLNRNDHDFFPREQADFFTAKDRQVLLQQEVLDIPEETLDTPRGPRILHTLKVTLRDELGQPLYLLGISEDITQRKQAEAALLEKESQYRMAVETSPDGFWMVDMQGRLAEVNEAYVRMSGYSREELQGMHVSEIDANDSDDAVAARIAKIKEHGHARYETVHRKKDGSLLPVEIAVTHAPIAAGRLFVFVTDLTERKFAEEAVKLQLEIIGQMKEGIQITRVSDHTIVYTTSVFDKMFGYQRNELIGRNVSVLNFPRAERSPEQAAAEINRVLEQSGYWQGEIDNIKKDGGALTCWAKMSSFEHHEYGKVWVAFHEDITERKQAELELQKARESVYRDVLIREVHHRIKNNLQGVIGVLRLSAMTDQRLASTINDLISQVQSIAQIHGLQGRSGMSKVHLCELTAAVAANAGMMWRQNIPVNIPENWIASSIRESESVPIALILNELIANAVKHGSPDSGISIHLRRGHEDNKVIVSIYNGGVIPQGFGLDQPAFLGTGLQLISSMMPHAGARLYWKQDRERVLTILELGEPTIHKEPYFRIH